MPSFYSFVRAELYRGYQLENDEERYVARRQKVYLFMKIPREVEKFMSYGFFQCTDAFLFLFTFLPLRFVLALWGMTTRPILHLFWYYLTFSTYYFRSLSKFFSIIPQLQQSKLQAYFTAFWNCWYSERHHNHYLLCNTLSRGYGYDVSLNQKSISHKIIYFL